jgi:hypothetical protein
LRDELLVEVFDVPLVDGPREHDVVDRRESDPVLFMVNVNVFLERDRSGDRTVLDEDRDNRVFMLLVTVPRICINDSEYRIRYRRRPLERKQQAQG